MCYLKSFLNHRTLNPISCFHPVSGVRGTERFFSRCCSFLQPQDTADDHGRFRWSVEIAHPSVSY